MVSKLSKILLLTYFIPFFMDVAITSFAFWKEGHTNSETNPLFILLRGNLWLFLASMIIIHVFLVWFILRSEKNTTTRFLVITLFVWLFLARMIALYTNITHILHPVELSLTEASIIYTDTTKVAWYMKFVGLVVYLPLLLQYIILKLVQIEYKLVKLKKVKKVKK